MWTKDSPLLQLPHLTAEDIKLMDKGKQQKTRTVQEYRELDEDERDELIKLTDTQKKDVEKFLKIYPDISVETKIYVDDDEDSNVYENDLVTVQVTITRNNLQKGERAGLVHAPYFPYPKKEAWWIILGQVSAGRIVSIEKVGNPSQHFEHRIKLMAPPKGHYVFDLIIKSNGYLGCDYQTKVEMECMDNSTLPEYKVHPEDAELDDEPTLFEEMLNAHIERDSDDEEEDVEDSDESADEQEAKNAPKSAAELKKEQLRRARQQEDDSDDDSDAAEEVYADK
jgi:translocation protein SEC63